MAFIYILFGWLFIITASQENESISFSPVSNVLSNSYWYGNISLSKDSSILEEEIRVKLQLNQYKGLLFYAIDSKYRTLWVEFNQEIFEVSFYNFKSQELDKRVFLFEKLCIHITDDKINLKFSLQSEDIVINCNGNVQTTSYDGQPETLTEDDLKLFNKIMMLPVPVFNIDPLLTVHFWIGNTPSENTDRNFTNINGIQSNQENLWGCIEYFAIKDSILKLATTGDHVGEMIKPFCNPVCNSNSCYNHGRCLELWRGRFVCDCGISEYIGDRCNLEYSVKFNGSFSLSKSVYFEFQKLQFSFKPEFTNDYHELKILSLKFSKNQSFQFYIDNAGYLHARLFRTSGTTIDEIFKWKIMHNFKYLLFLDINQDEMHIKIYNSSNMTLIDTQLLQTDYLCCTIEDIIVGGSHVDVTDKLKKFTGCFSNLIFSSPTEVFTWDKMIKFEQYPKCVYPSVVKSESLFTRKRKTGKSTISNKKKVKNVVYSYTAYILIAVVSSICLLIILIMVIVIKFYSRKFNKNTTFHVPKNFLLEDINYNPKDSFNTYKQNEIIQNGDLTDSAPCHVHPAPIYMTYKPPYKAKSLCSSITNRSLISLPVSPTPTLATSGCI